MANNPLASYLLHKHKKTAPLSAWSCASVLILFLVSCVLTILAGIKAGNGRSEHLNKVAHTPQVLVHVPEVSVDVVSIPGNRQIIKCFVN